MQLTLAYQDSLHMLLLLTVYTLLQVQCGGGTSAHRSNSDATQAACQASANPSA